MTGSASAYASVQYPGVVDKHAVNHSEHEFARQQIFLAAWVYQASEATARPWEIIFLMIETMRNARFSSCQSWTVRVPG